MQNSKKSLYHDKLTEMVRAQFRNLLDIAVPCFREEKVAINGFKLLRYGSPIHDIFEKSEDRNDSTNMCQDVLEGGDGCQNIKNAAIYEPRIEFIKNQLESLLSLVELESAGEVVKVDGFRLKNIGDWLGPSDGNPAEVFEHAATRCDCNCIFCYNKGVPSSFALTVPFRSRREEYRELLTRVKYFSPTAKRSIFPSMGSPCEALAHEYIIDILQRLREKTGRPFRIPTNGAGLSHSVIESLAGLKPVYLDISLNSSSAERRRILMRDPRPEIAISSLPLLKEKGIPYSVVIVPWPLEGLERTLEDVEKTIAYASLHDVHVVQLSLPGYSKYFSKDEIFNREHVWRSVTEQARHWRCKYPCPIVVMPNMYEEVICAGEDRKNAARITGVVKNSPAANGGLNQGDLLIRINGIPVSNRPQARDLLTIVQNSGNAEVGITVERDGRELELVLKLNDFSYPYTREMSTHCGVIFMGTGFRISYLEKLKKIIDKHGAKRVLILSSFLVMPVLEQCLKESRIFADSRYKIDIKVPENRFWGGNIFMGDLLVVQDYIDYLKEYLRESDGKPELVLIPSSPFNLSRWGRDLTGRVYLDIEREVGLPIEMVECATVFD